MGYQRRVHGEYNYNPGMRHSSIILLPVALFQLFIITNYISAEQNVAVLEGRNILENVCQDGDGKEREVGESWKEDCNVCRCLYGGAKGCTRSRCLEEVSKSHKESFFKTRQNKRKQVQPNNRKV